MANPTSGNMLGDEEEWAIWTAKRKSFAAFGGAQLARAAEAANRVSAQEH